MQITKTGSKPSAKGPEDWFTGSSRIAPLFDANEARRFSSERYVRTGSKNRLAHPSTRTNFNRNRRLRLDTKRWWPD